MNYSSIGMRMIDFIGTDKKIKRWNHWVAIGTTMKHIKHTTTTPIIIFSLQFLQYIILSSSLAFWLNWCACSFNDYDFFYRSSNCTWLLMIFLVLSLTEDLIWLKLSSAIEILSNSFMFSYFVHIYWTVAFACTFNDAYFKFVVYFRLRLIIT